MNSSNVEEAQDEQEINATQYGFEKNDATPREHPRANHLYQPLLLRSEHLNFNSGGSHR